MPNEFLEKVRAKYPVYRNLPDEALATSLVKQYPQYKVHLEEFFQPKVAPPPHEIGAGEMLGRAGRSIPRSGAQFATDIVEAVASPVETVKGLGGMVGNLMKAASPDPMMKLEGQQGLAPVVEHFTQKYGGWENIKTTFANDPIGFLADFSTVLGLGGSAVTGVAEASGASKLASVGRGVKAAGNMLDPVSAPMEVGKKIIASTGAPEALYGKALKLSPSMGEAERAAIKATGLEHEILPTAAGYERLQQKIQTLNDAIKTNVEAAARAGKTIDANEVVQSLDEIKEFWKHDLAPQDALRQLDQLRDDFISAHNTVIPIDKAQKIKTHTYRILKKVYDSNGGALPPVVKEGKKAMVRNIKEQIVREWPDLAGLNAEDSKLLRIEPEIERVLGRVEGANIMTANLPIWYMAKGDLAGGGLLALAKQVIESPSFKARAAIALKRARGRLGRQSKVVKPLGITGGLNNPRYVEQEPPQD